MWSCPVITPQLPDPCPTLYPYVFRYPSRPHLNTCCYLGPRNRAPGQQLHTPYGLNYRINSRTITLQIGTSLVITQDEKYAIIPSNIYSKVNLLFFLLLDVTLLPYVR